jgi:hypothetical protein
LEDNPFVSLHCTGRAHTNISVILQSTPQHSFVGSHEGSDLAAMLQEGKRWHGPDTQNALDGWNLIHIDLEKHNVGVMSS